MCLDLPRFFLASPFLLPGRFGPSLEKPFISSDHGTREPPRLPAHVMSTTFCFLCRHFAVSFQQAFALFSKEHNPRAPRFQCGGRDRGVAASLRRLWQTLGSRRGDYRLRSAARPIEHVAVAFWVEPPGLSSERLERSLRWLKCGAGQARLAEPVPTDKPRQALLTTHTGMMLRLSSLAALSLRQPLRKLIAGTRRQPAPGGTSQAAW